MELEVDASPDQNSGQNQRSIILPKDELKTGVSNALLRPSKVTKPNSTGTFSPNLCWLSNRTHCIGLIEPTSNNSSWQQTYLSCLQLFTRWTEAYALPNKEAATVAKVLESGWTCRFGVPDTIHSHQGANFEGHLFTKVGELLGIEKTRTTPDHPQSDGLVEQMNQTLLMMLSIGTQDEERRDEFLPELLMAYRASVQDTTKFTPFHLKREICLPR